MPRLHSIVVRVYRQTQHTVFIYIHHHIYFGFATHANTSVCRLLVIVRTIHTQRGREWEKLTKYNFNQSSFSFVAFLPWQFYHWRMPWIRYQTQILPWIWKSSIWRYLPLMRLILRVTQLLASRLLIESGVEGEMSYRQWLHLMYNILRNYKFINSVFHIDFRVYWTFNFGQFRNNLCFLWFAFFPLSPLKFLFSLVASELNFTFWTSTNSYHQFNERFEKKEKQKNLAKWKQNFGNWFLDISIGQNKIYCIWAMIKNENKKVASNIDPIECEYIVWRCQKSWLAALHQI